MRGGLMDPIVRNWRAMTVEQREEATRKTLKPMDEALSSSRAGLPMNWEHLELENTGPESPNPDDDVPEDECKTR